MGKSKRSDREFSREQKLSNENKRLKKELAHLRKQIARLDLEGLEAAKQAIFESEEKERLNQEVGEAGSSLDRLKEIWACNDCSGYLEITLYSKLGETYYFRKCNQCSKRTKGKRYDENVRGIIKK